MKGEEKGTNLHGKEQEGHCEEWDEVFCFQTDISGRVVSLISVLSSSKNMDIREYLVDILLTVVMIVSSLVLITRFWQDLIIAVAAGLMTLALGGLLLSLNIKMRHLERSIVIRERMLRTNLAEISTRMQDKYDMALSHLDELIGEFSKRAYK
jgi:hypothetical protein